MNQHISTVTSTEEKLWHETINREKRPFYAMQIPNEVFLLMGLLIALCVLVIELNALGLPADQQWLPAFIRPPDHQGQFFANPDTLQWLVTSAIPFALAFSAIFMALGIMHRIGTHVYEARIERRFSEQILQLKAQRPATRVDDEKKYEKEISKQLLDMNKALSRLINDLASVNNSLKTLPDVFAVSSQDNIEKVLNNFADTMSIVPERMKEILVEREDETNEERIEFRNAVSGFLEWPPQLDQVSMSLKNSTDSMSNSTGRLVSVADTFSTVSTRLDGFTSEMQTLLTDLKTTTQNLITALNPVGELSTNLQAENERIHEQNEQVMKALGDMIQDFVSQSVPVMKQIGDSLTEMKDVNQMLKRIETILSREDKLLELEDPKVILNAMLQNSKTMLSLINGIYLEVNKSFFQKLRDSFSWRR